MNRDRTTTAIAEFTASLGSSDVRETSVTAVVQHNFDAIACALGGFKTEPCAIARKIAGTTPSSSGCSVFGLKATVAPEQAVFANTTMIRQLDFNDANPGGGHPSDFIAAVFAAGELMRASGRDVVRGIYIGYEVFSYLVEACDTGPAGWDKGGLVGIAGAMGAGSVFGMSVEELANAVAIALVPNIPMLCTRHGELSNWKDSATAHGSMTGLFAARLAREGLTGPSDPFEGEDGFERQVAIDHDLVIGEPKDGLTAVERCQFKYHPAQIGTQGIIEPLIEIRDQFRIEDIVKISMETSHKAWRATGGGGGDAEEKWNPPSRETADHSLPFVTAISLVDGDVTQDSYEPDRLFDPTVHALMQRITITPSDVLQALLPGQIKTEAAIELQSGDVIKVSSGYPLGHTKNPMSEEHLTKKLRQMAKGVIDNKACSSLESALWDLDNVKDLNDLSQHYRAI